MQLSGTSFAAPVVAGAAANLLAVHADWTPDQVKGALMLTARPVTGPVRSSGVGELDAAAATAVASPPNPNAAVDHFVAADPAGGSTPVFDTSAWLAAAQADPPWAPAYWDSAYWDSAYWDSSSWSSAYWDSAYWDSAYWDSAYWDSAYWDSAYWDSGGSGGGVVLDAPLAGGGYWITPGDLAAARTKLGLAP